MSLQDLFSQFMNLYNQPPPPPPEISIDEQYASAISKFKSLVDYEEVFLVNCEKQLKYENEFAHKFPSISEQTLPSTTQPTSQPTIHHNAQPTIHHNAQPVINQLNLPNQLNMLFGNVPMGASYSYGYIDSNGNMAFSGNSNPQFINMFAALLQPFLQNFQEEGEEINPMQDEDFEKLQCVKYSDLGTATSLDIEKTCAICNDEYTNDCDCVVLNCKHYFHKGCIKEWLTKYHSKCPFCRADVSFN